MVEPMDATERALVARRVEQWRTTREILHEQRRRSVAALSEADGRRAALDLAASLDQLPRRPARASSGLVEQQRLFDRLRPA